MALPTYLFYGCKVKVQVPPEDSYDLVLASESDEELPRKNQINNVIPETNSDEDVYGVATLSSTFLKRKRLREIVPFLLQGKMMIQLKNFTGMQK
jgi:hypothetical protein